MRRVPEVVEPVPLPISNFVAANFPVRKFTRAVDA
jgi:hypothetical protein